MKQKTVDPCLKCPKIGKATKEGNRYCQFCPMKEAYLAAIFEACNLWTFQEDERMGICSRTQMWTSAKYVCPKCHLELFWIEMETRDESKRGESDFMQPPEQRITIRCANCRTKCTP